MKFRLRFSIFVVLQLCKSKLAISNKIMNADSLIEKIDSQSLSVRTDSLDISFGEILSMYEGKELEIRPSYQRLFRWTATQQSQFIESLLLGLPIPPIFVIETEARKYELIDGLQRISAFLHFMGMLESKRYKANSKLRLFNCEIIKELNKLTIDNLSPALRFKLKRSYVKMYVIKKESPKRIKYDMFKRLNTGGSLLEAQEIRNSTIRFLSEKFVDFVQKLAKERVFKDCIAYVQDYALNRQYDDELVLRYFTIKNANLHHYSQGEEDTSLADFLTKYAEEAASNPDFDYEAEEDCFLKVFGILSKSLGAESFSTITSKEDFTQQFYAFHYEAITIALSKYQTKLNPNDVELNRKIKEEIIKLKKDPDFIKATENKLHKRTSGSQYLEFLEQRISIAEKAFQKIWSK